MPPAICELPRSERVLVLAPTGRDAQLCERCVLRAGLETHICANVAELIGEIERDAGVAVVAEEALFGDHFRALAECLARQEPWSDLPVVLLVGTVSLDGRSRVTRSLGNVTWVERPTRAETLIAAVQGALRGRRRQYDALAARRRDEAELRRAADFQQRLIGISGHDLRNPLSAITMAASLLAAPGIDEVRRARLVRQILSSASRMERIVTDLGDYSRARVGMEMPLFLRPSDFDRICNDVLDEMRAGHPGRRFAYEAEGDAGGLWDPDRLKQVLSNLLTNAVKYGSAEHPVGLRWTRDRGGDLVVVVHNEGNPIEARLLPEIFEPFRLGAQNDASRGTSLGLGLFIARQIVRAHGGEISVKSAEDAGTTFTVRLPAVVRQQI